jgi:hypothetical protein
VEVWEGAKAIGFEEVMVLRTSFLSDVERRAFVLACSKLRELGEWDVEILNEDLEFLFDFEGGLDGTGFSAVDLDFSIPDQAATEERIELPDPSMKPVSRLGDLWTIGPHRLFNGDAKDPVSYDRVLGGELATLVVTDPPYGVPIQGHVAGKGATKYREFVEMSGKQTDAQLTTFFRSFLRNCATYSVDGAMVYSFIDWKHCFELQDAARGVMTELTNICVWTKPSPGLGSGYRSGLEFCLFAGSSTTILAAHRTHRRGAAIELDPLYVDCGLRRLRDATRVEPVRHDGRPFTELSMEADNG